VSYGPLAKIWFYQFTLYSTTHLPCCNMRLQPEIQNGNHTNTHTTQFISTRD